MPGGCFVCWTVPCYQRALQIIFFLNSSLQFNREKQFLDNKVNVPISA